MSNTIETTEGIEVGTRIINGSKYYTFFGMATSVRVNQDRPAEFTAFAIVSHAATDGWFSYYGFNHTLRLLIDGQFYVVEVVNGWPVSAVRAQS